MLFICAFHQKYGRHGMRRRHKVTSTEQPLLTTTSDVVRRVVGATPVPQQFSQTSSTSGSTTVSWHSHLGPKVLNYSVDRD